MYKTSRNLNLTKKFPLAFLTFFYNAESEILQMLVAFIIYFVAVVIMRMLNIFHAMFCSSPDINLIRKKRE